MEVLKNFGIQPVLLLAQIVNFAIILFVLKKFFYKPIGKVLDDRKKRIVESLKNADEIEAKLAKTAQNSRQILEVARTNAANIITEANKEAERIYEKASNNARKLTTDSIAQAASQIEKQRQEMQKNLERETLTLVVQVVKKVLGRSLKENERQSLSMKAISEIQKQIS